MRRNTATRSVLGGGSGIIAAAATLTFVALALVNAGRSYHYDEAVTIGYFVRRDNLIDAVTSQRVFNNHPLLTAVNWIVWQLGGTSEIWQRTPAIVAGALTVAVVTAWCAHHYGILAAACGGAFVALSPLMLEFGRQARGYSMAALFVLLATLLVVSERPLGWWYSALVGAALLAHLYAAIPIVAHGVALARRHNAGHAEWQRRAALGVLIAAPIYAISAPEILSSAGTRDRRFDADFPFDVMEQIAGTAAGGAIVVALLLAQLRHSSSLIRWITTSVTAAIALVWLALQPVDLYPRFVVWAVPLLGCLLAALTARWRLAAPLLVAIIGGSMLPVALAPLDEDSGISEVAFAYEELDSRHERVCTLGFFGESLTAYLDAPPLQVSSTDGCDAVLYRATDARYVGRDLVRRSPIAGGVCVAFRGEHGESDPQSPERGC